MQKFVITKGLPASGKSKWANEFVKGKKDWVRINNDDIQTMLFGEPFAEGKSSILTKIRDLLIAHFMGKGMNIIVDNTNLHPDREAEYRLVVKEHNQDNPVGDKIPQYEFQIKDFTDVSLTECLKRNKARANSIPEFVIKKMHKDYLEKSFKPMDQNIHLPKAIIVDIDGTVADISHRGPYEQKKVLQDSPIHELCNLVRTYHKEGYSIIYISGREEYCRADTLQWFHNHKLPVDLLLLNVTGEKRSSCITKKEIFDANVRGKYYVEFVLEDRDKNVKAWREMGLRCLQVDEGAF